MKLPAAENRQDEGSVDPNGFRVRGRSCQGRLRTVCWTNGKPSLLRTTVRCIRSAAARAVRC